MIQFLLKTMVTAVAVLIASYLLPGVSVNSTLTAVLVALVLGLLNSFIKPILIILTIPITIFTLGLFLLVINILIVKWASDIVTGFRVDGWLWALLFSLIVSFVTSLLDGLIKTQKE
jgi:putative membrane protein